MIKSTDASAALAAPGNNAAAQCTCVPEGAPVQAPKYSAALMRMLSQLVMLR